MPLMIGAFQSAFLFACMMQLFAQENTPRTAGSIADHVDGGAGVRDRSRLPSATQNANDESGSSLPGVAGRVDESGSRPEEYRASTPSLSPKIVSLVELHAEQTADQYRKQAIQFLNSGDYKSAAQLLHGALELAPASALIHYTLAVLCVIGGDPDSGALWLERARRLEPPDHRTLDNLYGSARLQSYYSDNHLLLERAIAIGISYQAARFFIGVLLIRKGSWDQAARQLQSAKAESFPMRDLYLMIAYHRLNREKEAAASLRNYRQRNPVTLTSYRAMANQSTD